MSLQQSLAAEADAFLSLLSLLLQKAETPAAVSPMAAPPADKKAKTEKVLDDFSLEAGLSSSSTVLLL